MRKVGISSNKDGHRVRFWWSVGCACGISGALAACLSFGDLSGGTSPSSDASTDAPTEASDADDAAIPPCLVDASSPFLVDAIEVSAGAYHTCAIRQDGSVVCWGSNANGELGVDRSITISAKPLPVVFPASAGHAVHIAAGFVATCMLDSNASVWCWGDQSTGELGDGVIDASFSTAPVQVVDKSGKPIVATQVTSGYEFSCAVTTGGIVQCWGTNAGGIFGDAAIATNSSVAVPVGGLRPLGAGGQLAPLAYSQFMCMIDDSGAACWGRSGEGELGNGGQGLTFPKGAIYTGIGVAISAVEGTLPLVRLSGGNDQACAIDSHRGLYCWGANNRGQVGPTNIGGPVGIPPQFVDAGLLVDIASGAMHNCGITPDGHAICFGDNTSGELGRGVADDGGIFPAPVLDIDGGGQLAHVLQLSGGKGFTCARVASTCAAGPGSVACWGTNANDQLGIVSGAISATPQLVQTP
jgi:alpha-tubulin suppressor-like RCC1 family protein